MSTDRHLVTASQIADGTSLAADFETAAFRVKDDYHILAWNISTASVTDNTGAFCVQWRTVEDVPLGTVGYPATYSDWATLTLVEGNPTLDDANATHMIYLNQMPPGEYRLKFVAAGGTPDGTCDIWLTATSIGG